MPRFSRWGGLAVALWAAMLPAAVSCKKSDSPAPGAAAPVVRGMHFVNVAPDVDLDTVIYCGGTDKDHILESTGSGCAFLDYDGDGHQDIYLLNAWALDEYPTGVRIRGRNVLFRGFGDGRFEDVTVTAGVGDDGWGSGVCTGDYDNDGLVDLYVTNFGPNRLYRNLGGGRFEEVSASAGVDDPGWGGGAAFFDADCDGDYDLYVVNYIDCTMDDVLSARRTGKWRERAHTMVGPFGLRGGKDRYFRNNGDGTFTDATDASGLTDLAEGYGLGVVASDLDNDGDVDLYVANDSNPNFLYRNDGSGNFTEIGGWSGAGMSAEGMAQAGMGVDAADFDGDGLQDLFVTNFARDHCTMYRSLGDLFYEDVTEQLGLKPITFTALSWACAFADFDLDADVDLIIINGHIYPQVDDFPEFGESYRQLPILLQNDGGKLVEVTADAGPGLQTAISGRGLALGDYDEDGDPDMLISAIDAPPLLLRNDVPTGRHWLTLRLLNKYGGPALNARAVVKAAGVSQLRELRSNSNYQSQNAMDLYFGLGSATSVESVVVTWPGGEASELKAVAVDQVLILRQPE